MFSDAPVPGSAAQAQRLRRVIATLPPERDASRAVMDVWLRERDAHLAALQGAARHDHAVVLTPRILLPLPGRRIDARAVALGLLCAVVLAGIMLAANLSSSGGAIVAAIAGALSAFEADGQLAAKRHAALTRLGLPDDPAAPWSHLDGAHG